MLFASEFDTFLSLNLELAADRAIFANDTSLNQVLESAYFLKGILRSGPAGRTLFFMDEIQKSPEAVKAYAEANDLGSLDRIHESLVVAYLEDAEKCGTSQRLARIVHHVIQTAFNEAAGRIRYDGFGNSNYLSRDIKEAFAILQKAFFQVVHPVTATSLPLSPDTKKSPRLHALDTGLVVFKTGMRKTLFTASDISAVFSGRVVEHTVGQELYATSSSPLYSLHFWAATKAIQCRSGLCAARRR